MESFEASKSAANTGTGARREGGDFETLAQQFWNEFSNLCQASGATCQRQPGTWFQKNFVWYRHYFDELSIAGRRLVVPFEDVKSRPEDVQLPRWLETEYRVEGLVGHFPGQESAIRRYAPPTGPYSAERYPGMYTGLTTGFDGTVLMVQDGVLVEKLLLEYKTGKASKGNKIDGNAHERLSFQIMQYLEVATRYTKCSLMVMANGAFIRYRNKYHVNFHVQADRLRNFAWFSMEHACTATEYTRFLSGLLSWLFEGTPRTTGSNR
jgi:hypothetical protein